MLTKDSSHKAQWELWSEQCEEPGSRVQRGGDVVGLEMLVQLAVVVVQQTRQLIQLNLGRQMIVFDSVLNLKVF